MVKNIEWSKIQIRPGRISGSVVFFAFHVSTQMLFCSSTGAYVELFH